MKQLTLLAGALLAIGFTACSDDLDVKREVPVTGEEVAFGTSLRNFETPQSRTIYGVPDGEDVNNYESLTINWVKGDKVRVYSPQATPGFQYADYVIDEATEGGNAHYFLVKDSHNDAGVRWGDVSQLHHFYAFYPTNINRNNYTPIKGLGDGQTANNMTVEAEIPVAQEHGELVEAGPDGKDVGNVFLPANWKLIRPDMTYAIMAGYGTWNPKTNPDKNVTINFKPIVTVVDVVVNGPADGANALDVYRVTINSKKTPIVGKFTAQFDEEGNVTFGGMPETITENNNMATINCQYNGMPTKLGPGEKLTLKFFLLPRNIDASELSVTVQINEGRVLTKSLIPGLGEDEVTDKNPLDQGKIVRVWTPNLTVPASSNWMSSIPDNVLFSQLSLPGSKHSYTGDLYNKAVNGGQIDENAGIMQYYQSIYVTDGNGDTQFDKGIRAFDLKIYNNEGNAWSGYPNYVYAGAGKVNDLTIGDVLDNLKKQMDESDSRDEACVVMLNYVSPPEISTWLSRLEQGLNDWNNSNQGTLVRIDPAKTTMGDMRGKIAVIINVPNNTTGRNYNFVNYIYGFSSSVQNIELQDLKLNDNQSVRMQNLYQVNNPDFETATAASPYAFRAGAGLVPYYITEKVALDGKPSTYYDLIGRKEEMMNELFNEMRTESYSSLVINDLAGFCVTKNAESTGSAECGLQTWTNVGTWIDRYEWRGDLSTVYDFGSTQIDQNNSADFKWNQTPSGQQEGDTWFKLGGSRDLGQGGNTVAFARMFNQRALDAVYNMVENGRVPLGIVLMNFAGTDKVKINNTDREVWGNQLPSTVMSNNFMFSLKTGTTTTRSSSKTSYTKAGNAWE
jgi:lipoprotein